MTATPHVLGLLPARGCSKGIPGKNMRPLCGKPLMAWASTALANAEGIARKICCTDDTAIAEAARKCGLETPWLRPRELAQDETLVVDVIAYALKRLQAETDNSFTHVVLVQATSPSVTSEDIDKALNLAIETNADTVITGFDAGEKHPARMFRMDAANSVEWIVKEPARMVRRQDLETVFIRTGLVYVMKSETILINNSIYGPVVKAIVVPEEKAINIDVENDFLLAENYLRGLHNI
jgi:CMP-N-acetylneuraminic acid synthetase